MSQTNFRRILIGFLVLALPVIVNAQTVRPVNATPAQKTADADQAAKKREADRLIRQRREQAQALLVALAADANTFTDQSVRARTQARIGDALWDLDSERARNLFRKAWDAAETADAEAQRRLQETIRQQQAKTGGGGFAVATPPAIQNEVLRLAAKHDRALGEEFLAKRREQKEQQAAETKNARNADPSAQRLRLAQDLLAYGDVERAMQFALPLVATVVSISTVDFLVDLRKRDASLADRTYLSLLSNAASDPQSDASTVSLLSSYIFTPHLYISYAGGGTSTAQTSSGIAPIDAPPEVRAAFIRTAASILMRPLPATPEEAAPAIASEFLVLRRLLPYFDQYATPETAQAIHAQFEAISAMASDRVRQREDDWSRRANPVKSFAEREQALLDQLDHAKTSTERDAIYLQLANNATYRGDFRARDYADKVEDTETRRNVRAYIDAALMMYADSKADLAMFIRIVHVGELTHLQKAWGLTQAARLLAKSDKEGALDLLNNALAEARDLETSDADRPRAFLAVVSALLKIDRARAWETMDEAIRAANSAETFTGEDGELTFQVAVKGSSAVSQRPCFEFNLAPTFELLAKEDFNRSVDLARGFEREASRANAVIAIALAVLADKPR